MGSRAAKRHQPGDLFTFVKTGIVFRRMTYPNGDFRGFEQDSVLDGTCGVVMERSASVPDLPSDALGDKVVWDYEGQSDWTPCLIGGERLWVPGLERMTKRLNRRSP